MYGKMPDNQSNQGAANGDYQDFCQNSQNRNEGF